MSAPSQTATQTQSAGSSSAQTLAQLAGAIVAGRIRVVDLTVPLESATPTIQLPPPFAPSKPFSLEEISRYDERGPAWYWNNIACGEHTGTHFDAPIHWVTGKDYANNATHNIPVERFIGPACVIDVAAQAKANPDFLLTREVVEEWERKNGRIPSHAWVLIRTDWSHRTGAKEFLNAGPDGSLESPVAHLTIPTPAMTSSTATGYLRLHQSGSASPITTTTAHAVNVPNRK